MTIVENSEEYLSMLAAPASHLNQDRQDVALQKVLSSLLESDGYKIFLGGPDLTDEQIHLWSAQQRAIDFESQGDAFGAVVVSLANIRDTFGIHRSHSTVPLTLSDDAFKEFIGGLSMLAFERGLVFCAAGFAEDARTFIRNSYPTSLECVDLPMLRNWLASKPTALMLKNEVQVILRTASQLLLELLAGNQMSLMHIEWRDLERLLAEAFHAFGFMVELTPSAKDGGKDIVLRFTSKGRLQTYLIEVKHWRCGKTVGKKVVNDFLGVVARTGADGGMIISSSGFTDNANVSLTEISRERILLEGKEQIFAIAKRYTKLQGDGMFIAEKPPLPIRCE